MAGSADTNVDFCLTDVTDVLWTLTDRCNLRCAYCGVVRGEQGNWGITLDPSKVERVVQQLHRLPGLESVVISGGEALTISNLADILRSVKRIAPLCYVITNGTINKNIDTLIEEKPRVMVTVDSTDEGINSITRGNNVLAKSLNTINTLVNANAFLIVIIVATRHNIDHIGRTVDDLYSQGVRNFLIQQLHCPSSSAKEIYTSLAPHHGQVLRLKTVIDAMRVRYAGITIDDAEVCFFGRRREKFESKCDPAEEYVPHRLFHCGAAYNFIAIKANGDVVPCNAFLDNAAGNIFESEIENILCDSDLMTGLRRLRDFRVSEIPGCENCSLSPLCDGGCRADAFNLTGEIGNPHPACPYNGEGWRP